MLLLEMTDENEYDAAAHGPVAMRVVLTAPATAERGKAAATTKKFNDSFIMEVLEIHHDWRNAE